MNAQLATAIATVALAGLAAAPAAFAQGPESVPAVPDCSGILIEDGTGDTGIQGAPIAQGANNDIKAAWLRWDVVDGEPAVTVNIQVADLNKTVPAGADNVRWYFYYPGAGGETQSVLAELAGGNFTFHYGHVGADGNAIDGTTTGRAIEGPNGILQIQFPSARVELGARISDAYVQTQPLFGVILPTTDRAPNSGAAQKSYVMQPCPGATPAAPAVPVAPVTPGAPAKPANTSLPVKLAASKAKPKGRTMAVKLSSAERCASITAKLTKGRTSYGTGKLSSLDGKGTLRLKLAKRKLRKGTYTLTLSGTDSSGAKLKRSLRLRVG